MLLHFSTGTDQQAQALVGQYHSGRVLPLVLVGIAVVLGGFLLPYVTRKWESGEQNLAREQLRWSAKLISLGFTGAGLLMLVAAPLMFETVLGGRYADGYAILPITLVYCIWYSTLIVVIDYLWVLEKGKFVVAFMMVGLVVNVAVNYFAIPICGLYGAVFGTAISNVVSLVMVHWFNQRHGLRMDRGLWLTIVVPLVLLLPLHMAAMALILVGLASLRFEWLLDQNEKDQLMKLLDTALQKVRRRKPVVGS